MRPNFRLTAPDLSHLSNDCNSAYQEDTRRNGLAPDLLRLPQQTLLSRLRSSPNFQRDFAGSLNTGPASLNSVFFELTPECNSRCNGCSNIFISHKSPRKMTAASAPLDLAGWARIIEKLSGHVELVKVTGGEPTLYKYFGGLINLLENSHLPYILFTNARWSDPFRTTDLLSRANYLGGLLISLHGRDAATHDAFTLVPGSFDEAVQNIKRAVAIGIPVVLSSIITKYNFGQTTAITEFGQQLGAKDVVFNRYIGRANDACQPDLADLKKALNAIELLHAAGRSVRLSISIPQCFRPNSTSGCGAGDSFWTVDPWGNAKPCSHAPLILGNLLADSVERIMDSPKLAWWRTLTSATCDSCSLFSRCGGGCRAEAMLNHQPHDSLIQEIPLSRVH